MIPAQKLAAYALASTALVVLLSSTVRIGLAILSNGNKAPVDFDVHFDEEDAVFAVGEEEPVLPINRRKLAVSRGDSGPGGVSDTIPGLVRMSSSLTRRVDERELPHECGVVVYDHHVPGEGGDALDAWIEELVRSNGGASSIHSSEGESKESFLNRVESGIENIGPGDWKIVRNRNGGLAFDADGDILRSWRDKVERGGECRFVAAVVFSDPLDHSIKQTKRLFSECQCSMMEFKEKIWEIMEDPWEGQLDQFLFGGNNSSMEMKEKVRRGVHLLRDHFELVMVHGRADLAEEILRITGWQSQKDVERESVSDGELVYSKDLVSRYGKISAKNGDADFIDAVNHVYHNSLAYLMLQ